MSLAPKRVYAGRANGRIRYFHIKMPVAVEQDRAIFAYIDPGTSTRSPLHSWGQAHRQLWDKLPQASRTVEAFTVAWDRHHLDRTQRVLQAWTTRDPAAAKTEAAGLRPRPPWRSTAVPSLPPPPVVRLPSNFCLPFLSRIRRPYSLIAFKTPAMVAHLTLM